MPMDATTKQTIMIVEDDALLRGLFEPLFLAKGMDVVLAIDGQDALDKSKITPPPSLVILDLMMPRVDGFAVLEAFKKNDTWKNIPVVIFTNFGNPDDRVRAMELGADAYIIKSAVSLGELIAMVEEIIAKHQQVES